VVISKFSSSKSIVTFKIFYTIDNNYCIQSKLKVPDLRYKLTNNLVGNLNFNFLIKIVTNRLKLLQDN
jgi:hypothetical protein